MSYIRLRHELISYVSVTLCSKSCKISIGLCFVLSTSCPNFVADHFQPRLLIRQIGSITFNSVLSTSEFYFRPFNQSYTAVQWQ